MPIIRPYTLADRSALLDLINSITAEGIWLLTDHYVPTPQWENVLAQPADLTDHLLLISEANDCIVGWCQLFPIVFGNKSRHVVELGIGIAKAWRDKRIGIALVNAAIEWARQQGFEKIILSSFSTNTHAIHMYEKVGFACTGTRYKQYIVKGEYVDEILMERFL